MKFPIATICIISIGLGYIIGKSSSSFSKETQIASKTETSYDRSKSHDTGIRSNGDNAPLDSILGGRSISEIPAADLAAIFIKLSKPDPNANDFSRAKQAYQLQFLLSKLSATELVNIANESSSDPETKNSPGTMKIISALTAKDPDRALDWLSTQEDSSKLYPVVISTIAKNNPLAASSLLRSAMIDGKIAKSDLRSVVSDIAKSTAKIGSEPFFSYLDSLPKEHQGYIIYGSIFNIHENDRIKFLEQIHQRIQGGSLSQHTINHVFSHAVILNKSAATEWFNKLPENEQKNNFRTGAAQSLYLSGDKESAIGWMKEALAASPGREKEIIHGAIQYLQLNKPEGVPVFANLLPEGVEFSAKDITYSPIFGSEGIPILASVLSDPNEKSIFIANSIKIISNPTDSVAPKLNSDSLDILSRQIAGMGFTGQNATRVNDAIEAAKKQLSPTN